MSIRPALLLASAALAALSAPAMAQDGRYDMDGGIEMVSDEVVQPLGADAADMRALPAPHHPAAPRLAYSPQERESWLADCRLVMLGPDYYYANAEDDDEGDDADGGLLGGLLGAVIGGVAGNRIGGAGDRLAGTLIGAGVGGIAGAVLGGALDGDRGEDDYGYRYNRDAEEAYAADYCDAYLRRYEASGQAGYGQMAYAHVQPVMMVSSGRHPAREIVHEEWIEEAAPVTEHRRVRRQAPRRERGKLTAN